MKGRDTLWKVWKTQKLQAFCKSQNEFIENFRKLGRIQEAQLCEVALHPFEAELKRRIDRLPIKGKKVRFDLPASEVHLIVSGLSFARGAMSEAYSGRLAALIDLFQLKLDMKKPHSRPLTTQTARLPVIEHQNTGIAGSAPREAALSKSNL